MMNAGDNIIGEKRNAEACQENEGKRLKQSTKAIPITLIKRSSRLDGFTLLEYLPKERIQALLKSFRPSAGIQIAISCFWCDLNVRPLSFSN